MSLLRKLVMNEVHLWECGSAWLVPSSTVQSHLLELSMLEPGIVSIFDLSGRLSRTQPVAIAVTCRSILGDAFQCIYMECGIYFDLC